MSDPANVYALDDIRTITGPRRPAGRRDRRRRRGRRSRSTPAWTVRSRRWRPQAAEQLEDDDERARGGARGGPDRQAGQRDHDAGGRRPGLRRPHRAHASATSGSGSASTACCTRSCARPKNIQGGLISRLKVMADLNIAEKRVPQDGRISDEGRRQARSTSVSRRCRRCYGEKVVIRVLDKSRRSCRLEDLGFLEDVLQAVLERRSSKPYGAILVTGPTGSGKSTTMYATLNILNQDDRNIITVEDPVEYRLAGVNQMQVNPKAGLTFASALRSILRADPDIVLIGEIRDKETATIAIEAALTGHLVLSSLHTNDAPSAISRLVEMEVETFLVASAIDCRRGPAAGAQAVRAVQGVATSPSRPSWRRPDSPNGCGRRSRSSIGPWVPGVLEHRLPGPDRPVRGDADDRRDRTAHGGARVCRCTSGTVADRAGDDHASRRRAGEGPHGHQTSSKKSQGW